MMVSQAHSTAHLQNRLLAKNDRFYEWHGPISSVQGARFGLFSNGAGPRTTVLPEAAVLEQPR